MAPKLSEQQVMQYLRGVLGQIPASHAKGLIRLPCALGSHLGCYILLDPRNGQWYSRGNCGRGDLFDYAALRFKIFDPRQSQTVVLRTIREAQEKADLAEQAIRARRAKSLEGLGPGSRNSAGLLTATLVTTGAITSSVPILAGVSSARHCGSSILAGLSIRRRCKRPVVGLLPIISRRLGVKNPAPENLADTSES